jgi:hypothetical protein
MDYAEWSLTVVQLIHVARSSTNLIDSPAIFEKSIFPRPWRLSGKATLVQSLHAIDDSLVPGGFRGISISFTTYRLRYVLPYKAGSNVLTAQLLRQRNETNY